MSFLEGTPSPSHNAATGPMSFPRGYPGQVRRGGYPRLLGWVAPLARSGWGGTPVYPTPILGWGPTWPDQDGVEVWSYPPPPCPGMGYPPATSGQGVPPSDRTTEGVLTVRGAVCLLRSRRTFLYCVKFS